MSKNLEIKKEVVAEIVKKIQNAQSMVIVEYNGLTVAQATELRALCRAENVDYCVLKNRLVARALKECGIEGLDEALNGPSAFAFCDTDAVAPARIINDFVTKNKLESLSMKAGLLGKEVMNADQVKALAAVPSREILLARLLGCLQNSIGSFVRVVDAIAKKMGGATEAAAE